MTKPNVQQAGFGMVNISQLSSTLGSIVSLQDQAVTALKTLVQTSEWHKHVTIAKLISYTAKLQSPHQLLPFPNCSDIAIWL